jgi:hypothetical protein
MQPSPVQRAKPSFDTLIAKYIRQQRRQMGEWHAWSKRERSPGYYHRPGMGDRYPMRRQWHPTRELTEKGKAAEPAGM